MSETVVIFRKDRTGWKDTFALFPELPATSGATSARLINTSASTVRRLPRLHCQQ